MADSDGDTDADSDPEPEGNEELPRFCWRRTVMTQLHIGGSTAG